MKATPTREVLFQRLQRAHLKVSKITVLLEYADDANKKDLRRKLRIARAGVETAVGALLQFDDRVSGDAARRTSLRRLFSV